MQYYLQLGILLAKRLTSFLSHRYSMLLHQGTRDALGIDVRDSVVILDEAHNIIESINSAYSCSLNLGSLHWLLAFFT